MSPIRFDAYTTRRIVLAAILAGVHAWPATGLGQEPSPATEIPAQVREAGQADATPTIGSSESLQVLKSGPDHARIIYQASALPVLELAQTVKQLFEAEHNLPSLQGTDGKTKRASVAIATSIVSNSMVISGPPEAVQEVRKVLDGLDQPRRQVLLTVEIGETTLEGSDQADERPQPVGSAGQEMSGNQFRWTDRPANMKTIGRLQLTTLDGQPSFAQMGARVPMVLGISKSADGEEVRNTSLTNVGLIVGMTPRVTPNGSVVMDIDVEQSQLGPEAEGIPISMTSEKVVRAPQVNTTTIQSTVTVADGQSVILGAVTPKGQMENALVVVITPHILASPSAAASASATGE